MWKMLGITKQSGDEKIKNSFVNGYLYYYGVKNIKNLASNDRAAIAKDLLSYTKQYINSPAFTKEYTDMAVFIGLHTWRADRKSCKIFYGR